MMPTIPKFLILCFILWVGFDSYILVNIYYLDISFISITTQLVKYSIMFLPALAFLLLYGVRKKMLYLFISYNILLLVFCAIGKNNGYDVGNIILSIKNVYLWVWYALLLCCFNFNISDKYVKMIFYVYLISAFLSIAYSIYINIVFDGDFKVFYFFDLYTEKGIFQSWNFIRDGKVRAFGLVGSKLTLSQMLVIPCSIVLMSILYTRDFFYKLLNAILGLFLLYGMYITYARNPLFALTLSFAVFIFFQFFKLTWKRYFIFFIVIYSLSVWIVSYLNDSGSGDASSQARIPMLLDFFTQFSANPLGHGIGSTGIANQTYFYFYESGAATIFMDLGGLGGCIYWASLIWLSYYSMKEAQRYRKAFTKIVYNAMSFSLLTLLLITNFTNIFDFSLIWYSFIIFIIVMYRPAEHDKFEYIHKDNVETREFRENNIENV